MSLILSIETSSDNCSVALRQENSLLASELVNQPHAHAAQLAPLIQTVLKKAGIKAASLNAVAVSSGPGSYTGLRIGTSTAKGICVSLNIPLIAVPTLQIIAREAFDKFKPDGILCPMIDARRMEVYCQTFNSHLQPTSQVTAKVIDENAFAELLAANKVFFFGNGSEKCKEVIKNTNAFFLPDVLPNAITLGYMALEKYQAGEFEDVVNFAPFYLKEFVAKKSQSLL
ncbi:tRNA (adenosine(37)-N6)-threonylcarbamoyltransferase complex dimerization subunit type 1 TsaB [Chryseosolibacter indicus]|uniref:tRNA (Adenosine(37)-N6)-threonylcarbamoyltransferase complex dimerization subunit type 1 TsaB n=1 Tax=Chryseosolibacter indicus TaxID=2782351 RepID=A0ABS5VXA1_9BACT|nr:tRNA (adenosine(37)-N6)-threonylcarbamoyltransferase complex dimerization subunit type 1 TsaB [Chryseosolibacter indicus]MBT1706048.1 tRNA (adenosine(37)-N6)-threonylcarbamoyltransferase complex dimerization subunit type 1 TsaB [Chryseosolibacter indicus]